jgi:hypothetical protein
MLTLLKILRRSLLLAVGLLAADVAAGYLLTYLRFSFVETFGDLMLGEIALLFIAAGILDLGFSVGVAQFRKAFLESKQGYSSARHKEFERRAAVLLLAGLTLFAVLVFVAVYELR